MFYTYDVQWILLPGKHRGLQPLRHNLHWAVDVKTFLSSQEWKLQHWIYVYKTDPFVINTITFIVIEETFKNSYFLPYL